jgi:hypothetical protein
MSNGGHHSQRKLFLGRPYPRVVIPDSSIVDYFNAYGNDGEGGAFYATLNVLNQIKADTTITNHLRDFDLDEDGTFDFVFLYYRSMVSTAGQNYFLNECCNNGRFGGISHVLPTGEPVTFVGDSMTATSRMICSPAPGSI